MATNKAASEYQGKFREEVRHELNCEEWLGSHEVLGGEIKHITLWEMDILSMVMWENKQC